MSREHVDVLIVGAGLSGVGAGCRLREQCPDKTFAILEARGAIGGTWDLFRFPGIRSDSDMFTLCYPFRPWSGAQSIVDGSSILDYIRQTAREHGVDQRTRFHHRVVAAEWSSADALWTVEVERTDTGETVHLSCGFLFTCTGYYRYDEGYTPEFQGIERFGGEIVHPQFWTDDVDHSGKRVVVIGSGATAVTLIPALAQRAEHVTMLQRSPSYIVSLPAVDPLAGLLGRVLPTRLAYPVVRWKNVVIALAIYGFSRSRPAAMKRLLRRLLERRLPPGYDVDTHFNPRYEPWDQRLCIVPDGDLFDAIGAGRVSVVTDRIESVHGDGPCARVGVRARGRPDRHRHRAQDGSLRRDPAQRRRQRRRVGRSARVQGDAAEWGPQHGVRFRVHEPVLDARRRPHVSAGLPVAEAHGTLRLQPVHATQPGSGDQRRAIRRTHFGLRAAGDRPVPEAGVEGPVAEGAELCA